ncbi:GNAT family N-acetyltransferase [Flagellimonas sp. 389]|uniref:GNAT family N-acetyltransferase n=1 Tax=Flagellimonas sp. 389 TaxID=2835862 RepID=UPI001BD5B504|nr:GNAT family N-acetyltransferase [Flagellimonas sp. 389]MBS9462905.1 GNAT family N-acetyltransferase [Flagellimonas sp. 389]
MIRTKYSNSAHTGNQSLEKNSSTVRQNENMYLIKNTEVKDFEFICWMYEEAIKYQKRNNYFGWESIDKEYLKKEIKNGLNYKLIQEGNILCAWGVVFSDPLIWREMEKGTSIYMHRVVVNPNFKGQKLFQKVLEWAIDYSVENSLTTIRIDTWTANPAIIEFYEKYGFKVVEEYTTGDTKDLPIQHRNLDITLLEYSIR